MTVTKSTVAEIRERFDNDVERFSNLETGQTATIDAPLAMELVAAAAAAVTPGATRMLDIGCGAGNYSLRFLDRIPGMEVDLLDLSRPMLDRALARVSAATTAPVHIRQTDIRDADLGQECFDVVVAAASLHHLRSDVEWEDTFARIHRALRPGGSFWITDLIEHSDPGIQQIMWERYGEYLAGLKGESYRDQVYSYVEKEDTPRPLIWQLDLLRSVGFRSVDVLHKNSVFAAFGAMR